MTTSNDDKKPDMPPRCGAKKRNGDPCRAPAMKNGRCRLHGGLSTGAPLGNKNGYRHGFYYNALSAEEQADWPEAAAAGSGAGALEADLVLMRIKLKRLLVAAQNNTLADTVEHYVDALVQFGTDPKGLPYTKKELKASIPRIGELIVQAVDQIRKLSLSIAQLRAAEKALAEDQADADNNINVSINVVAPAPIISTED